LKILLLAYEVESNAILELSKMYKAEGHATNIMNCDYWTFTHNKNWYKNYKNYCDEFNNIESEFCHLNSLEADVDVDFKYLSDIEQKYSLSFNKIIKTDPILYTISHERDDYVNSPTLIKYKWIEIIVRKVLQLLEDFKPDYILTINNNYFIKNLIFQISKAKEITFLTTLAPRIGSKSIISSTFGFETDKYFKNQMENVGESFLNESKQFIKNIIFSNKASYDSHEIILKKIESNNFFIEFFQILKGSIRQFTLGLFHQKHYRGLFKSNYLDSHILKGLRGEIRNIFRRVRIYINNSFVTEINSDLKYYYIALHVIPESSILTNSLDNLSEMNIIEEITSKMPIGTFLVIKENIEMLGIRSPKFYKNLSKLDNAILIDPNFNSMALIKNSLGVISMCGTNLVEACIANKRGIIVGTAEYSALSFIEKYNKYDTKFPSFELKPNSKNNILQFIQTINILGVSIDQNFLLYAKYQQKNLNYLDYLAEVTKLKKLFDQNILLLENHV